MSRTNLLLFPLTPFRLELQDRIAYKAVALDPQLAEGHAMLGLSLLYFDWDWLRAEKELKLALELNPTDALYL